MNQHHPLKAWVFIPLVIVFVATSGFGCATAFACVGGGSGFVVHEPNHIISSTEAQIVKVHQLHGPTFKRGRVIWSLNGRGGARSKKGFAILTVVDQVWSGHLPDVPGGSEIRYHFEFDAVGNDDRVRYPEHRNSFYRSRVLPLHPGVVEYSHTEQRQSIRLTLPHRQTQGELVWRSSSGTGGISEESRFALVPQSEDLGELQVSAVLPQLQPGQIGEFYVSLKGTGDELRLPADAPARLWSIKRSIRVVEPLPANADITALAAHDNRIWVGTAGGGISAFEDGDLVEDWGVGNRLPSANIRFLHNVLGSSDLVVGTDAGVVVLGQTPVSFVAGGPRTLAEVAAGSFGHRRSIRRAATAAQSSLDGSVLLKLEGEFELEKLRPASAIVHYLDGRAENWIPTDSKTPVLNVSALGFDEWSGCWLLGGYVADQTVAPLPAISRVCGDVYKTTVLTSDGKVDGNRIQQISQLVRHPYFSDVIVVLDLLRPPGVRPPTMSRVFRLRSDGSLLPISGDVGDGVTGLLVDSSGRRVLIATRGGGLLEWTGGGAATVIPGFPATINALAVLPRRAGVLVGASRRVYQLSADNTIVEVLRLPGHGLPADALPGDTTNSGNRVLSSSYSGGLFEIVRTEGGWRVERRDTSGVEIPDAHYGSARYGPGGDIFAIVHSRGLLHEIDGTTQVFGVAEGLLSPSLLSIQPLQSGAVWLAHSPQPAGFAAGGGIQLFRDERIVKTVAVSSRELATVTDWVEVPERNSVFAATRAGTVELSLDGSVTLISAGSTVAVVRQKSVIGIAGSTVARWNGTRFEPVLFQAQHPRWPRNRFVVGGPLDMAIDETGIWHLLYAAGTIVLLDGAGLFVGVLDWEDGIPRTSRKLETVAGGIIVGSARDGMVYINSLPTLDKQGDGQ